MRKVERPAAHPCWELTHRGLPHRPRSNQITCVSTPVHSTVRCSLATAQQPSPAPATRRRKPHGPTSSAPSVSVRGQQRSVAASSRRTKRRRRVEMGTEATWRSLREGEGCWGSRGWAGVGDFCGVWDCKVLRLEVSHHGHRDVAFVGGRRHAGVRPGAHRHAGVVAVGEPVDVVHGPSSRSAAFERRSPRPRSARHALEVDTPSAEPVIVVGGASVSCGKPPRAIGPAVVGIDVAEPAAVGEVARASARRRDRRGCAGRAWSETAQATAHTSATASSACFPGR